MGIDFFIDLIQEGVNLSRQESGHLLTHLHEPGALQEKGMLALSQGLAPWLTDVEMGLMRVDPSSSAPIYLCGGARIGLVKFLSKALHRAVNLHHALETAPLEVYGASPCFVQAIGLTRLSDDAINFRRLEFAHPEEGSEQSGWWVAALVMILLLVLAVVDFSLHTQAKEKQFTQQKQALKEIFQQTFPGTPIVTSEVIQTEAAIAGLRTQLKLFGTGMDSPLRILTEMTEAIPQTVKIYIIEWATEGKTARIEAEALSFDAVDQIRSALAKVSSFEKVVVSDANVSADSGRIGFRVRIALKSDFDEPPQK